MGPFVRLQTLSITSHATIAWLMVPTCTRVCVRVCVRACVRAWCAVPGVAAAVAVDGGGDTMVMTHGAAPNIPLARVTVVAPRRLWHHSKAQLAEQAAEKAAAKKATERAERAKRLKKRAEERARKKRLADKRKEKAAKERAAKQQEQELEQELEQEKQQRKGKQNGSENPESPHGASSTARPRKQGASPRKNTRRPSGVRPLDTTSDPSAPPPAGAGSVVSSTAAGAGAGAGAVASAYPFQLPPSPIGPGGGGGGGGGGGSGGGGGGHVDVDVLLDSSGSEEGDAHGVGSAVAHGPRAALPPPPHQSHTPSRSGATGRRRRSATHSNTNTDTDADTNVGAAASAASTRHPPASPLAPGRRPVSRGSIRLLDLEDVAVVEAEAAGTRATMAATMSGGGGGGAVAAAAAAARAGGDGGGGVQGTLTRRPSRRQAALLDAAADADAGVAGIEPTASDDRPLSVEVRHGRRAGTVRARTPSAASVSSSVMGGGVAVAPLSDHGHTDHGHTAPPATPGGAALALAPALAAAATSGTPLGSLRPLPSPRDVNAAVPALAPRVAASESSIRSIAGGGAQLLQQNMGVGRVPRRRGGGSDASRDHDHDHDHDHDRVGDVHTGGHVSSLAADGGGGGGGCGSGSGAARPTSAASSSLPPRHPPPPSSIIGASASIAYHQPGAGTAGAGAGAGVGAGAVPDASGRVAQGTGPGRSDSGGMHVGMETSSVHPAAPASRAPPPPVDQHQHQHQQQQPTVTPPLPDGPSSHTHPRGVQGVAPAAAGTHLRHHPPPGATAGSLQRLASAVPVVRPQEATPTQASHRHPRELSSEDSLADILGVPLHGESFKSAPGAAAAAAPTAASTTTAIAQRSDDGAATLGSGSARSGGVMSGAGSVVDGAAASTTASVPFTEVSGEAASVVHSVGQGRGIAEAGKGSRTSKPPAMDDYSYVAGPPSHLPSFPLFFCVALLT